MSEDGLHPFETILRLCAAAAPEPWYPRLFAKQEGVDRQVLGRCLEDLWLSGLIERTDAGPEKGPAISLTREGHRVLLDPEAMRRLRAGEPLSSGDRAAVIRQALRNQMRPLLTVALVLLNVLVFAWGYSIAREQRIDNDFLRGAAQEREKQNELNRILQKSGSLSAYTLIDSQWWRLLTAGFVHIGFLHLLMNMLVLYLGGRFIEQLWGHFRYLLIYLAGVLGGSCLAAAHNLAAAANHATDVHFAGASGAICGLLAAEAVWFLFNRRYLPPSLVRQARTIFLVNLVLLVFISSFQNVSGWGHFGGAAAGALTAMLLQLHRFGPPLWRWLAIIGFVPMIWYGHYAIVRARTTDPNWLTVEGNEFLERHARPVHKAMKEARRIYDEEVEPLLERHPTRRDPEKVEALGPVLEEQKRKLIAVADALARAGPYYDRVVEEAQDTGWEYVRAGIELFDLAERVLRLGEKRTDKDRHALQEQKQRVQELYEEWRKLVLHSRALRRDGSSSFTDIATGKESYDRKPNIAPTRFTGCRRAAPADGPESRHRLSSLVF
jgi:rhomboid protease GluP